MHLDRSNISCGIYQFSGIAVDPASNIEYIKKQLLEKTVLNKYDWAKAHARPPIIIFSDQIDDCGQDLADYITNNKLGQILESPVIYNPSILTNKIKIYTWLLDYKALKIESLLKSYS